MPELGDKDFLQPSLLDRLTDTSRFVERLVLAWNADALKQAGTSREQCRAVLEQLGLRRHPEKIGDDAEVWHSPADGRGFRKLMELRPRPNGPTLSQLVEVRDRGMVPNTLESREERVISGRRLRQSVLRDLTWLLNTVQISALVDLGDFPEAQGSVLNYGIPDMTGMTVSGVDPLQIAEGIRVAVQRFEPRIQHVTVTPEVSKPERRNAVSFVIEGMLWGQPLPERLYVNTEVDLENASVTIRDSAGRDV